MQLWSSIHCQSFHTLSATWTASQQFVIMKLDITASLLTEVCHNVATEPPLQPHSGESITPWCANSDNDACLDICAIGFYIVSQDAFYKGRIFYLNASTKHSTDTYLSKDDMNTPRGESMKLNIEYSPPCSLNNLWCGKEGYNFLQTMCKARYYEHLEWGKHSAWFFPDGMQIWQHLLSGC